MAKPARYTTEEIIEILKEFHSTLDNYWMGSARNLAAKSEDLIHRMTHKICPICNTDKPMEAYVNRSPTALRAQCKKCTYERVKQWKSEKPKIARSSRSAVYRSPWGKVVMKMLEDGEWHSLADLVEAGSRTVPPGIAIRAGIYTRTKDRKRSKNPEIEREDPEVSLLRGSRRLTRGVIYRHAQVGRLEIKDGKVRMIPNFPILENEELFEETVLLDSLSTGQGGGMDPEFLQPSEPDPVGRDHDEPGDRVLSDGVQDERAADHL